MRIRTLLASVLLAGSAAHAGGKTLHEGDLAPNVTLKLVSGGSVSLDELRGQVVVLNFWATWCVPCRAELPLLDAYYRIQRSRGLRVYAVTTEDSLPTYRLKPLFDKLAIEPVRAIKAPYQALSGVPTNYIIDRAGRVRYMKAGAFDLDALNTLLVPLLREPPPPATPPAAG
jgi:thiol-disulfide isomerase/thioredoxin